MSPLQWTLLCGFFTIYLLFGGTIFMVLEQHSEILNQEQLSILRQDVQEILLRLDRDFYHNETSVEVLDALRAAKEGVINRISDACGGINFLDRSQEDHLKWNYYNSVFFAFTIVTTIGYGHLAPSTEWSRVFVIFYALVGIPINGILLQGLGDYFSTKLVKAHKKSKEKRYENKLTLIFDIIFYLIPGLVIFIVLPAGIFTLIENWSYMDSIYYAFVTLLTIGFGDFVAGIGDGHNIWLWFYKAFIIIWIVFGLGYLIMILGFITKGLTHKKVRIVIENRLNTIRSTKEKLSKDVEYMRRVINELYMMKIKPVFPEEHDEDEIDQYYASRRNRNKERTQSHPCLRELEFQRSSLNKIHSLPQTPHGKRRGSVLPNGTIGRTLSEADLDLIDKNKTFEDAMSQCVLPDELLAAVVGVLNHNVVQDVLDAVDELNEFEELESAVTSHKSPQSSKRKLDGDFANNVAAWNLAKLNESDEEVLIAGADGDFSDDSLTETLEEVVIHVEHDPSKPPSQKLLDKVNTAIRKISTGAKTPSEGPSRKVSRNESDRKKKKSVLQSTPPSRRTSQNDPPDRRHLNVNVEQHGDWGGGYGPHAHHSGRSSVTMSPRLERASEHRRSGHHGHHSISHSRKISEESNPGSRPITVETTSLADFLRALDTVHHKLKHVESSRMNGHGHGESQDEMNDDSQASGGSDDPLGNQRQRKVGVFNPGFSYVNHAFDPDNEISNPEHFINFPPASTANNTNSSTKNETNA